MDKIKSKNFILRLFKEGDEKSLQLNINNKKIYKNTSKIPYPYTLKHAREWINKCIKEQKKKNPEDFNFVIDIEGQVAGSVGFSNIKMGHKAELGYWLGGRILGQRNYDKSSETRY